MSAIPHNLQAVRDRIALVAQSVGRSPDQVLLLAVSKTFGADAVIEAVHAGANAFGENYLQEALDKMAIVASVFPRNLPSSPHWHFIGPIQSNKTRQIAEHFDWVHTVDREKIAQRLSDQRPPQLPRLQICLQVNISAEPSKSGVPPEQVSALAHAVVKMPRLVLRGLMAIPEPSTDIELQKHAFRQLRLLLDQLRTEGLPLDTLSMGMSTDMSAAIAEGATIVRIGSAIFGERNYV